MQVQSALYKTGCRYVGVGGGITGDVQINDTDLHSPLKSKYREKEMALMLEQLREHPGKIPKPSRDEMMRMMTEAMEEVNFDVDRRMKSLWLTNALGMLKLSMASFYFSFELAC